jgi:RNA polymerase sigma-70 factor, ECF subfamily
VDEQQLIKELKEGKEPAFKLIVDSYQKAVVNTCFGLVHNPTDSEDIAQEVFIEVFNSIYKFRSDAKLSTWIYRIAVNKSFNFNRDNKRRKYHQPIENSTQNNRGKADLVEEGPDLPGYNLENSERAKLLYKAIDELPENQKIAFTLNKYEDLSYQEISEVMEMTLSSVESLIHRAKKNLQKKLYHCYKKKCI